MNAVVGGSGLHDPLYAGLGGAGLIRMGNGGWTPLSEPGLVLWLNPKNLATVWQDAAGTIPGAVGALIGRISDLSGNGFNATISTESAKPRLTDPGDGFLEADGDGIDDRLSIATSAVKDRTVASVFRTDVNAIGVSIAADSNNLLRFINPSLGIYWTVRTDAAINHTCNVPLAVGTKAVCIGRGDSSLIQLDVNGVSATPIVSSGPPQSRSFNDLFNRALFQYLNGGVGEWVIYDHAVSDETLILLREYLAISNGVMLP